MPIILQTERGYQAQIRPVVPDDICWVCGRTIRPPYTWVLRDRHTDEVMNPADADDRGGWVKIGPECLRRQPEIRPFTTYR